MLFKSAVQEIRSEQGQGMTEYIIMLVLIALLCIPIARTLPAAIQGYVRPFYYILSKPIP